MISLMTPKPNNKKIQSTQSLCRWTDACHSSNPEERTSEAQHQQLANEVNVVNHVAPRPGGASMEAANNNNSVGVGEEPFQPTEFAFPAIPCIRFWTHWTFMFS